MDNLITNMGKNNLIVSLFKKDKKNLYQLHLMLLPAIVLLVIYSYIPMLGIIMAFEDFIPALGFFKSQWVGFENFRYLIQNPDFYQVLFNTIYIAVLKILGGIVVPVTVALLLNEIQISGFKRSVQTVIYLPHFISWVLLSGIIIDLLSPSQGLVNNFLASFGIEPIFFLADNKWFPITLVLTNIWKEFGWGTIIYLAALTSIDPTLYEAAIVDGAGRWRQTISVTLPCLIPTIILMSVLSLGNILNAGFEQVFNLYSPMVYKSGDIIDTFIYRVGIVQGQYSLSAAVGFAKSLVAFLLIFTSQKIAYKVSGYKIF